MLKYLWLAAIIDWIFGDPRWIPHPVVFIGKWISFIEKNLRKTKISLRICGLLLVISTLGITLVCIQLLLLLSGMIHPYLATCITVYLLSASLAARCLKDEVMKVYEILKKGDLEQARTAISWLVGRDTSHLNEKEITRAAIETAAENTIDGVLARLFYLMIGLWIGYPVQAVFLYKAINTMDSMVGYLNEKYREIGFFAAKLDDLANYLPARLGSFLMLISGLFFHMNFKSGFRIWLRDRRNHKSPNCAYPESAVAGLLQIQLGGTNRYFNETVMKPTIGDCVRELNYEDIRRSTKLIYASELLLLILFSLGQMMQYIK